MCSRRCVSILSRARHAGASRCAKKSRIASVSVNLSRRFSAATSAAKADAYSSVLDSQADIDVETGEVEQYQLGLARVSGLPSARVGSLVRFVSESNEHSLGLILALHEDEVTVCLLNSRATLVDSSSLSQRQNEVDSVSVGQLCTLYPNEEPCLTNDWSRLKGRIIDPLGRLRFISSASERSLCTAVHGQADALSIHSSTLNKPRYSSRAQSMKHWQTGVKMIDLLHPLRASLRTCIVGTRGSGMTGLVQAIAINVLRHSHGSERRVVYCSIGKSATYLLQLKDALTRAGVFNQCTIIACDAQSDALGLQYISLSSAVSLASAMSSQADVLLIVDDLTAHAKIVSHVSDSCGLPILSCAYSHALLLESLSPRVCSLLIVDSSDVHGTQSDVTSSRSTSSSDSDSSRIDARPVRHGTAHVDTRGVAKSMMDSLSTMTDQSIYTVHMCESNSNSNSSASSQPSSTSHKHSSSSSIWPPIDLSSSLLYHAQSSHTVDLIRPVIHRLNASLRRIKRLVQRQEWAKQFGLETEDLVDEDSVGTVAGDMNSVNVSGSVGVDAVSVNETSAHSVSTSTSTLSVDDLNDAIETSRLIDRLFQQSESEYMSMTRQLMTLMIAVQPTHELIECQLNTQTKIKLFEKFIHKRVQAKNNQLLQQVKQRIEIDSTRHHDEHHDAHSASAHSHSDQSSSAVDRDSLTNEQMIHQLETAVQSAIKEWQQAAA